MRRGGRRISADGRAAGTARGFRAGNRRAPMRAFPDRLRGDGAAVLLSLRAARARVKRGAVQVRPNAGQTRPQAPAKPIVAANLASLPAVCYGKPWRRIHHQEPVAQPVEQLTFKWFWGL